MRFFAFLWLQRVLRRLRKELPAFAAAWAGVLVVTVSLASAAAREKITVYTALENEQIRPLLADFQTQNPGVEVEVVRDSNGVIAARLLAEADNPRADVVWQVAATTLMMLAGRELLEPYAPAGLSSIRPRFRDAAEPPRWVAGNAWMTAFACNTVELRRRGLPVPKSYADLADPRYRGLITMPHPGSSGTGFMLVSGILQTMGESEGWAYLDALHRNVLRYEHSGSRPAKQAAAGECAIGISFCYASLQARERGAPIEVVFPAEGSGWEMEASALVRKREIAPAARRFLDWATGRSAVTEYGRSYGVLSREDVRSDRAGYPADVDAQMAPNDLSWAASHRDRILEEWNRRYGSGK
ncbi:MAG: putative 2-aminoethylphosphonate ABC transporter substrate-binding protein [Tepidisphaerales bacterium]